MAKSNKSKTSETDKAYDEEKPVKNNSSKSKKEEGSDEDDDFLEEDEAPKKKVRRVKKMTTMRMRKRSTTIGKRQRKRKIGIKTLKSLICPNRKEKPPVAVVRSLTTMMMISKWMMSLKTYSAAAAKMTSTMKMMITNY
ncbi:hypothetical protein [Niabella ginsengisoli]|uniref:Uncharacterized protein n=1 Tax=Niabella ginsengisoli TaxID=522298 RepID=A0ABS9SE18_9BACT|nr:hypothetical protein [Niabella ginsengisoli]MCH5596603.1 hypothetical protein [Niabella ginsengisoli]